MGISSLAARTGAFFNKLWNRFLGLARWVQIIIVLAAVAVVVAALAVLHGGSAASSASAVPTVTVARVDSFGANANGVSALGTVTSLSEADILAQSGGTVTAVHTTIGANVPAGFVIASLDSAAASAAVLQAQGAYDAAVAAQRATNLQANQSTGSLSDAQTTVRNTYQSSYTTAENAIVNDADVFFGDNTPVGPQLLINPLTTGDSLPRERRAIDGLLSTWSDSLASVNTTDPLTLLSTAQANLTTISSFLADLSSLAQTQGSGATSEQLASLAAAQSTINGLLATISSARVAYNTAVTAAAVGQTQSSSGQGVTSSEATVEQALGGLRAAQAAYEKTVVRAPIAGTINYLPIHVGDYATPNEHVATVARNNALEVVMQLSQDDSNRLAVGNTVTIEGTYKGVVTSIAPALDPTTKQIEVHIALDDGTALVNGQSVQVALPTLPNETASTNVSSTTPSTNVGVELPLTAVKLLPNERDVFTVDPTGHVVAHKVDIGDVVGDRIQVTTPLDPSLEIITDARGLSAGDAVVVSTSTPQ